MTFDAFKSIYPRKIDVKTEKEKTEKETERAPPMILPQGLGLYSDLYDDCQLLVCPGDLAHRIARLSFSLSRIHPENPYLNTISNNLERSVTLWYKLIEYYPDINKEELNEVVSALKKAVSTSKGNYDHIVDHTILMRNEINRLFKYPQDITEVSL